MIYILTDTDEYPRITHVLEGRKGFDIEREQEAYHAAFKGKSRDDFVRYICRTGVLRCVSYSEHESIDCTPAPRYRKAKKGTAAREFEDLIDMTIDASLGSLRQTLTNNANVLDALSSKKPVKFDFNLGVPK